MSIYKPYDIRGTVPDQLDPPKAWRIGHAYATFLIEAAGVSSPICVVGRDGRAHSPAVAAALMAGLIAGGAKVVDAGLCTTPMLYHAVGSLADGPTPPTGGVMVTASHNGPRYNGFKLCRALAAPVSMDTGLARVKELEDSAPKAPGWVAELSLDRGDGTERALPDAPIPRAAFVDAAFPVVGLVPSAAPPLGAHGGLWRSYTAHIAGMKRVWPNHVSIAVDPANGMGCFYLRLFQALGAEVHSVHGELASVPAHEANPLKPENMREVQEMVRRHRAVIGVGLDGDADRVVFTDESGEVVPSDITTGLLAREMLKRAPGSAVLYDLRSSRAVRESIQESGGRAVRERVGHSFMKATLRRENAIFGGELSGHFYFRDCHFADNSAATVVEVLNLLGASHKGLRELAAGVRRYAQSGELNFHVADKDGVMKELAARYPGAEVDWLDGVTVQFDEWWFNVRPSNTEPLLRLNVEARDGGELARRLAEVSEVIGGERE